MIKHHFCINRWGVPDFKVEDNYWMLHDLVTRDIRIVKKIIKDLESVINGDTETTDIEGYDTTIVECSKNGCLIFCVGEPTLGPIPVEWVLQLFKDWLDYLIIFEESKEK
jgi:hypothetical protein